MTDMHLVRDAGQKIFSVDTFLSMEYSLKLAMSLDPRPDYFILTGDLTDDGASGSYERLMELLAATGVPVCAVPGNHDQFDAMARVFEGSNVTTGPLISLGGWTVLLVRTEVPEKSFGTIKPDQLLSLEENLAKLDGRPAILALHHPPVKVCPSSGCELRNADGFLKLIENYPNVKLVLSGHLHMTVDISIKGTRFLTSPSTFAECLHPDSQSLIDVEDFWASHRLDLQTQGFRVVDLGDQGQFTTQVYYNSQS